MLQPVCLLIYRFYRYEDPVIFSFFEFEFSVGERIKGMIPAQPDIKSGIMSGTSLADNNIPGFDYLTAEKFHSQPFAL
jgi:hypothetical protein